MSSRFIARTLHRFARVLSAIGILAFVAGLSSCSLYEGPPPPRKKEFRNLGCLKDFGARLLDYSEGRGSPEEVNRLADCSISALRTFRELARGENRDRFTAQEIRNFLQRYFLEDVTISDSLLRELMRVKQALLGGKSSDFSPSDLKSAEAMIETVRKVLLRLHSSMPISLDRLEKSDEKYVDETVRALADAADMLGEKITQVDSIYTIGELGRLLDEFCRTFPARSGIVQPVRDNLKIAGRLKELLVSPNGGRENITAREWKLLLQEGASWLSLYAKFMNLRKHHSDWTRGQGRSRFAIVVNEAIDILARASLRHCPTEQMERGECLYEPGVPFASIQELIDESDWDGEVLGLHLRKSTLTGTFPIFVRHVLGGTDFSERGRGANRVTKAHLERLRSLFTEWVDGMRFLEGSYARLLSDPSFDNLAALSTKSLLSVSTSDVLRASGGVSQASLKAAEDLRKSIEKTYSLTRGASNAAYFDGKNPVRERTFRELSRYAWLRPLLARVVEGYQTDGSVGRAVLGDGLSIVEFRQFITDYWAVLDDLNFVGPSNNPETDAKKRMREASLFTQVSDGNEFFSVDEGVQLILLMFSADPMTHTAHKRIVNLCQTGPVDEWDQPTIEPNCYRRNLYDFGEKNPNFGDLWKSFPLLMRFYAGLDADRRAEFLRYVEVVSRKKGYQEKVFFTSSDTQTLVMVFHYVEGLFVGFDKNSDGKINEAEAENAFPVFRLTLAETGKLNPQDSRVKKVFFWLLAKGSPPITEDMGAWRRFWHGVGFLLWSWRGPDFEADRLGLLKVFAALASSTASANSAKTTSTTNPPSN